MDEAREALRQHVRVAEAPFLQAARLEVLDQHVRRFEQAQEDGLALRLRDVEAERALVAVDALEIGGAAVRSEEHTSELQSLMRISYAVFCLKKQTQSTSIPYETTTTSI